jgi:hypothetical protein
VLFRAVFFLIAIVLSSLAAIAQLPTDRLAPQVLDSARARRDSLNGGDSTAGENNTRVRDSLRTRLPMRDYGAPFGSVTLPGEEPGYSFITKREMVWERYATSFDLLARQLPAYPLSQGVPGLVRAFSYGGSSPSAISTLYDGRPLKAPGGKGYDLELYPTEYIERVEILRGARAAIFGNGESLIALNFVQPRYDAEGSYGRFWYYQAPGNTTSADLTYARNVGGGANLALGFRRIPSEGVFPRGNQNVSNWSVRGTLRWDRSDALSFSLTEIFSDNTRGLNGGLTDSSSIGTFVADVLNDTLQQRSLRHDLTLSTRWYFGGTTPLAGDTTGRRVVDTNFRLDGSLYYSFAENELQSGGSAVAVPGATGLDREGTAGARAGITALSRLGTIRANGSAEVVDRRLRTYVGTVGTDELPGALLRYDLGGLIELTPFSGVDFIPLRSFAVIGGAKVFSDGVGRYLTAALEGTMRLTDSIGLRGTLRSTFRYAGSADCGQWAALPDSVDARYLSMYARGQMIEAAAEWKGGAAHVELGAYLRRAVADECTGLPNVTITGADVRVAIPLIYSLVLDNHIIGTFATADALPYPSLYGTTDLYGQWKLVGGNLDLRLGTSLTYQSRPGFTRYDNLRGEFYVVPGSPGSSPAPLPLWDAYAQGRIGSAYLRIEIRNILSSGFYTVYRYPTYGQGIFLGFNWALID